MLKLRGLRPLSNPLPKGASPFLKISWGFALLKNIMGLRPL